MANGAPGGGGRLSSGKGNRGGGARKKPSNKGLNKASRKTAASGKGSKTPRRGINRG